MGVKLIALQRCLIIRIRLSLVSNLVLTKSLKFSYVYFHQDYLRICNFSQTTHVSHVHHDFGELNAN